MAILNTNFPTNLTEYPNSFKRQGAFPLEAYSVFYDVLGEGNVVTKTALQSAQDYASSNPIAYVGQILAVVNKDNEGNESVTAYVIDDADGNLKEVGSSPVGDESTIIVDENGTISLKGANSLVFERDVIGEDGQPTGEKEEIKYQPLMTKTGLIWVEPSKTTVEGLATLIDALDKKVAGIETTVNGLSEVYASKLGFESFVKEVVENYATEKDLENYYTTTVADAKYATKEELSQHKNSAETTYATKEELTAHSNTAAQTYATKEELTQHSTSAASTYATKEELANHESTADGKYATKEELTTHSNTAAQTYATKVDVENTLKNYSTTEEVNTAIGNAIGSMDHLRREIVTALPEGDAIDTNTIYMVARGGTAVVGDILQDVYDEYLYINNQWEKIGDTIVDLSNYYTKEEISNTYLKGQAFSDTIKNYTSKTELETVLADYYTEEEADAKFVDNDELVAELANYYTKDEADAEFINGDELAEELANYYTEEEADAKFIDGDELATELANYYTKEESDNKYALKDASYTKGESDAKYAAYDNLSTDEFTVGEDHTVSIKAIDGATKVTGWADKADKTYVDTTFATNSSVGGLAVEVDSIRKDITDRVNPILDEFGTFKTNVTANSGIRLINQDEINKLTKLVLGENGEVGISGTINASNVKELDTTVYDLVTRSPQYNAEGALVKDGLGVERGAQVNKIEHVLLADQSMAFMGPEGAKIVKIPRAGDNDVFGLVRNISSDKENFVKVHQEQILSEDGKTVLARAGEMEVVSLNVNKLVQTPGERLILNGGNASLTNE